MTDMELSKAKKEYKELIEGKKRLIYFFNGSLNNKFAFNYFNVDKEKVNAITNDVILRNTYLSVFQETKESSNLLVYINHIARLNDTINDGQPDFVSIDWKKKQETMPNGMHNYALFCDLETNHPVLFEDNTINEWAHLMNVIWLPDYSPKEETYHYNSKSLEVITKGSATEKYNRLQLYYFKELLESTKKEDVVTRMKHLTKQELREICEK